MKLKAILEQRPKVLQLVPGDPLYTELVELKERKERRELEVTSHDDIWAELPQIQ